MFASLTLCHIEMEFDFSSFQVKKTHYGNPKNGCLSDEMAAKITGASGDACLPKSNNNRCPTDLPANTTAKPYPAVSDPNTGNKYCVLMCRGPLGSGTCPTGARCVAPGKANAQFMKLQSSVAICLYPTSVNEFTVEDN